MEAPDSFLQPDQSPSPSEPPDGTSVDMDVFFEQLSSSEKNSSAKPEGTKSPTSTNEKPPALVPQRAAKRFPPFPPFPPLQVIHSQGTKSHPSGFSIRINSRFAKPAGAMTALFALGMLLGWATLKVPPTSVTNSPRATRSPVAAPVAAPVATKNSPVEHTVAPTATPTTIAPTTIGKITLTTTDTFALQVAACRSQSCLEKYQQLLATKVPQEKIHTLRSSNTNIQQIRIFPLAKSEAQLLKTRLATLEPKLAQAYVVKLHPPQ